MLRQRNSKYSVYIIILLFLSIIGMSCDSSLQLPKSRLVRISEANSAYNFALSKLNKEYVWGGQGPDTFDCSGLILWAYQQSIEEDYNFVFEHEYVDDITMDAMYKYNSYILKEEEEVEVGDIVFITNDNSKITHGGLVFNITESTVVFINASSFYGKVSLDEWSKNSLTRGQWIVGYGRLKISEK